MSGKKYRKYSNKQRISIICTFILTVNYINMKKVIYILLLMALVFGFFTSCQKEKTTISDVTSLKKRLDTDPQTERVRELFHQHTRILASFSREELESVFSKTHSCGFYAATATLPDLEKCLEGHPRGSDFLESERFLRDYQKTQQELELRYPELAQMETRQKMSLLFIPNIRHANEVVNDFMNKKQNK